MFVGMSFLFFSQNVLVECDEFLRRTIRDDKNLFPKRELTVIYNYFSI